MSVWTAIVIDEKTTDDGESILQIILYRMFMLRFLQAAIYLLANSP
ncbi:MAG: hypothetical protein FWH49_04410 [Clostridiales bacterium]|nr:hypothetical protein [Clostridiales bacterium]